MVKTSVNTSYYCLMNPIYTLAVHIIKILNSVQIKSKCKLTEKTRFGCTVLTSNLNILFNQAD